MSDGQTQTLEGELASMVANFGIHVVVDALLALASGSTIGEVVQQVERHAIRIAADIEAEATLK
jgi:hypothetical protein